MIRRSQIQDIIDELPNKTKHSDEITVPGLESKVLVSFALLSMLTSVATLALMYKRAS